MKPYKYRLTAAAAILLASSGLALAEGRTVEINREQATPSSIKNLAPYPAPQDGWTRYVIHLPYHLGEPVTNGPMSDPARSVELLVGKVMEVDCNSRSGSGQFVREDVEGWGYGYYRAELGNNIISTLIGCPDDSKREAFVAFVSTKTNYNSALPLVVYAPENAVLRYRFWTADADYLEAR